MKKFWAAFAALAVKAALYAAEHPDQVIALISQVKGKNVSRN